MPQGHVLSLDVPFFFFVRRRPCLSLLAGITVCTGAYLTHSRSWQLECQLGTTSKRSPLRMYTLFYIPSVKHQLPAGPMCPSSHNLPWLSKPLVRPIYSLTADHKSQGIHLHPHGPCVTLVSPSCHPRAMQHLYPLRNT